MYTPAAPDEDEAESTPGSRSGYTRDQIGMAESNTAMKCTPAVSVAGFCLFVITFQRNPRPPRPSARLRVLYRTTSRQANTNPNHFGRRRGLCRP